MPLDTDPKYVRLRESLVTGCVADVDGSGWFIGGRDVKPFPSDDEPVAQEFVRSRLRNGMFEVASTRERNVVVSAATTLKQMHLGQLDDYEAHDRAGHQEAQLLTVAGSTTRELDRLRRAPQEAFAPEEDDVEVEEPSEEDKQAEEESRKAAAANKGETTPPSEPARGGKMKPAES